VNLESAAFLAGNVAEAAVFGLLVYRRAWRTLPFFCIYSLECLVGSILFYIAQHRFSRVATFNTYFYESILDFALQFCVLVEVAWSILRPFQKSLPRYTVWVLGALIAGAGLAIWPFVNPPSPAHIHVMMQWHLIVHLQETVSVLRVLFFLVLAGCSQLLSIGWRDRELQVTTGLGFYSFVSLSITVWHSHQTTSHQYAALERGLAATYLCVLLYWVFSFAHKEAERRQFSPQMQSVLLAVAGAARSTRVAMADSSSLPLRKRGEQ
jgi:hypothetical protein